MGFDTCDHKIRQLVIKAGIELRIAKGLPPENNVTILFNETAPLLGISAVSMSSTKAERLPAPHEVRDDRGNFIVPRKPCPECNADMILISLCPSCKDSDNGKYRTAWLCEACQYKERLEEFYTAMLIKLGVSIPNGSKEVLGIKTLTDEGIK